MNPMVGPAYSELLYLQAGRLNPGVVKAVITVLPLSKQLRIRLSFVSLSKSRKSQNWSQEALGKGRT